MLLVTSDYASMTKSHPDAFDDPNALDAPAEIHSDAILSMQSMLMWQY